MGFFLLGLDSLIACLAIAPIVGRRALVPLAVLFGVADGVGFLVGATLGWRISDDLSDGLQTGLLVLLGGYLIAIALLSRRAAAHEGWLSQWPLWVLPWALCLDNLTYGLVGGRSTEWLLGQAGEQALATAVMALVGLVIGMLAARYVPALRHRIAASGLAGGALVAAAGVLLLAG